MVSLQNFLQLDDYNGVPLAAGKIYVYKQGRTELAEIYSDINGETPIANPAILDDLGMQEIYVSNVYNYTVVVTDPYNNELFTRDIYPNGVDGSGNNRLYEGIDPIVVNNDKMAISAKKATLSVQDPLYFVEDSQSAVCIGLQESAYSGLPYIENSALGFDTDGNVSSISGLGFYALSAGSATIADSASISYSAENAGLVTDGWETGSDGRITAYNGTAFSAGKVYSGISPVYVDNTNNKIGVSSKDFLANAPLYFTEYSNRVELSISGLPPTPGLMYESGFNYASGKITGYNGSGISAGKVYSGISPVTVDNVNDTISVASAILGVQAPLYFVEDSESATVIGLNSAQIHVDIPESANWNEAYSTVNNNSGDWQSAADELAVLNTAKWEGAADTLSSHSADWNNKLDADIYAEDSGNFYTTANESGFITGVDLTDYATKDFVNDNVASSISGKLDIATYSSESGNFLTTADSSEFYPMTGNPSGFLTGETDWTNTITAASAHAYSEATAQIPTDYATTAQLADKLDSATYAADSGTFLTAHQSLPESADWNSAASAVSAGYANWNSTYNTVSNNSASWTGGGASVWESGTNFGVYGGVSTTATNTAVAWGEYSQANNHSLAVGYAKADINSIAVGSNRAISTDASIAVGDNDKATICSLALGYDCSAEAFSVAQGSKCSASDWAQAFGQNVQIIGTGMAIGQANQRSAGVSFVIGRGSWNGEDWTRADIFYIDSAGNVSASGDISANGVKLGGGSTYTGVDGLISAIDTSGLYAVSATSALTAATTKRLNQDGTMGKNITQSDGANNFLYMPTKSPWTPVGVATGIFSPLQYATGACLAMAGGGYAAYFKGNEWYVCNTAIGQALRGETHNSRGVHISGATTAGYGFNLGINSVSGVNSTGSWKYGHAEDAALRAVSSCDMHESAFGYDASNNITAYNGSAFKAGDEFPQSATEAIEVVTGGSANWNSTTATVATNSGAWGGSGIEISAGFGINIQLIDNKLVISLATATGDI